MAGEGGRDGYGAEYAAFFEPRTHAFETVDLRTPASALNRRHVFPASAAAGRRFRAAALCLAVLVGACVAGVVFASDQVTRGVMLGTYRLARRGVVAGGVRGVLVAVAAHVVVGSAAVAAASVLVVRVAPLGASSGIPQLKAVLNGVRVPGFLALRTGAVKAFGIGLSTGGGLISGRQGAMGHVGAVVGAGMSQAASAELGVRLFNRGPFAAVFRMLRTNVWKMNFAAVGAAIGVAITFRAPMGGWMWVYEEAVSRWDWSLGVLALGGCLSGVFFMNLFKFLAAGTPGGGFAAYQFTDFGRLGDADSVLEFPFKDLPGYMLLAVAGGVFGALLPLLNKRITLLRYRFPRPLFRVGEVAVIAALTNAIRLLVPYYAGGCAEVGPGVRRTLDSIGEGDFSQFNCPDGSFSPWAAVMYNPLAAVVRVCLYTPGAFTLGAVPLAVTTLYLGFFIVWSFGLPVPAGVFLSSLVFGSVYGRLAGVLVQMAFPARTDVSVEGYAFVGIVSALSGVSRNISVAVIALEATGVLDASYVAVLVAFVSRLVSQALYKTSIYDLHIALKGMPYLSDVVPKREQYDSLVVADLMSARVVAVRCHSRLDEIVQTLTHNRHNAFPVVFKMHNNVRARALSTAQAAAARTSAWKTSASSGVDESTQLDSVGSSVIRHEQLGSEDGSSRETGTASSAAGLSQSPSGMSGASGFRREPPTPPSRMGSSETDGSPKGSVSDKAILERNQRMPYQRSGAPGSSGTEASEESVMYARRPMQDSTQIVIAQGPSSFEATLFENGEMHNLRFSSNGRALRARSEFGAAMSADRLPVVKPPASSSIPMVRQVAKTPSMSSDILRGISEADSPMVGRRLPPFCVLGLIDRGTLLALLDAELTKAHKSGLDSPYPRPFALEGSPGVLSEKASKTWFDAAWPNASRVKNPNALLERVNSADIGETIISLSDYLDPEPLILSDQATAYAAYKLFRETGARHVLVMNLRECRVGGILTRKDILPESIAHKQGQLHSVDTT